MKRFIILIIAVIVVSVLWMVAWFYIAGQVREQIATLAQADGITQPRLVCDSLDMGGAPFSFAPRCTGAVITSADTTITLPEISGTALFYRPFHIQAFATGPARISDAFTGASQELDWSNLHASLRIEDNAIERFSAIADDLVYADRLMGDQQLAMARHGEIHLVNTTPENPGEGTGRIYDVYTVFEDVQSAPLDIANGTISLDGQLTGVPDPALWGDPDLLAYWQAYDGQLTLRGLDASADGIAINAQGQAALDQAGLLGGNLEITSEGVSDRIVSLVGDPAIAQIILGSPDDSGVSRQNLTISEGQIVVGIIPIMAVPPLF